MPAASTSKKAPAFFSVTCFPSSSAYAIPATLMNLDDVRMCCASRGAPSTTWSRFGSTGARVGTGSSFGRWLSSILGFFSSSSASSSRSAAPLNEVVDVDALSCGILHEEDEADADPLAAAAEDDASVLTTTGGAGASDLSTLNCFCSLLSDPSTCRSCFLIARGIHCACCPACFTFFTPFASSSSRSRRARLLPPEAVSWPQRSLLVALLDLEYSAIVFL
mmetsp:Transcript_30895/g.73309  ORF Transcript_30895/g.73309 Transcript_30895/m.73309 type:complete len:221 (+) Transcript_30895:454-1116(+)